MKANPLIIRKSAPGGLGRGARVAVPGVFPSASRFGEQVVKFRVNSLDSFIGGGVPIGSICIIRDEFPSQFGDMLLKSFVADAATYNHRLYVASENIEPCDFAESLPTLRKGSDQEDVGNCSDLKIAWRYGQQDGGGPGSKLKPPEQNQLSFDFSKKCSVKDLGGKNLFLSKCCGLEEDKGIVLDGQEKDDKMLREILEAVNGLDSQDSSVSSPTNVTRIAISHCEPSVLSDNFLLKLRSIVQHTNSCAVITLSDMAYPVNKCNLSLLTKAEHFADIVILLRAIIDPKRRNELGGIDGVCCIKKTASNNTLKIFEPPKDVGFSFKKKRLLFHELHLPPEGEDTTQREVSSHSMRKTATGGVPSASGTTGSSCGSTFKGKSIDF